VKPPGAVLLKQGKRIKTEANGRRNTSTWGALENHKILSSLAGRGWPGVRGKVSLGKFEHL
jgi:hypothetical protein